MGSLRMIQRFIRFRHEWWSAAPCHYVVCNRSIEDSNSVAGLWLDPSHPSMSLRGQIGYWYERTDYMQFPHIIHFEGAVALLDALSTLDAPAVVREMHVE